MIDLDRIKAIDIHVHTERSRAGHDPMPPHLREAAATWGAGFAGLEQTPPALAGPYGGTLRISGVSFSLARYSAVPGLRLSGALQVFRSSSGVPFPLRFVGSVTVAGPKAAHGRLKVGRSTLTGRLGGRGVRAPA